MSAGFSEERHYSFVITVFIQRVEQLAFHPFGFHRFGRQYHKEPIAAPKSPPDLIVPLFRTNNVGCAIPVTNAVPPENFSEISDECAVTAGVREEDFFR